MIIKDQQPNWHVTLGEGTDLGIGIVGCGGIVQYAHLPAYRAAGFIVRAVYDLDGAKAREVASEWEIPFVADSVEELAARDDVSIVDIAVPPEVQPGIVATVAAAGKHVLCQKPLANDLATAKGIVDTVAAAGITGAVNQQMRWDAGILASRELIESGAIGTVTRSHVDVSVATPWHMWPWLASSPRLEVMFHSIHYLDAVRSVLGDPVWVSSVHGRDPRQAPVKGETKTVTVLEFDDSIQAHVTVDHYNTHGEPRAEFSFVGTEGALEGTIGLMYDYPDGRADTLVLRRKGSEPIDYPIDQLWVPDAFAGPMSELMDSIGSGRQPSNSVSDNLTTIAMVQACYASAEQRRSIELAELLAEVS
jgi:predicted dehydrogenase